MYLADDPRPPLPEWIQEAYTRLVADLADTASNSHTDIRAISRDEAVDSLLATTELDLAPEDANHAIERLLDRGYFYEVDDELRVTSPLEEHGDSAPGAPGSGTR